jgi:cell division protein FtsB
MRRRLAKTHLKSMRREAKDLGKLQQSNEALKEEIELLRARAKDDTRRVLVEAGERSVVVST